MHTINYSARLGHKVQARNQVNRIAIDFAPEYLAALAPFVGQKVCNVGGELSKKVKDALPPFVATPKDQAWVSTGHGYNVTVTFKTCVTGEGGTFYAERTVYLGELDHGVLVKLCDQNIGGRTDYEEAEIIALREKQRAAQDALRAVESQLSDFGMHDN